jgi:hypothetical protein
MKSNIMKLFQHISTAVDKGLQNLVTFHFVMVAMKVRKLIKKNVGCCGPSKFNLTAISVFKKLTVKSDDSYEQSSI